MVPPLNAAPPPLFGAVCKIFQHTAPLRRQATIAPVIASVVAPLAERSRRIMA
jgi:hypothetical protein